MVRIEGQGDRTARAALPLLRSEAAPRARMRDDLAPGWLRPLPGLKGCVACHAVNSICRPLRAGSIYERSGRAASLSRRMSIGDRATSTPAGDGVSPGKWQAA